MDELKEILSSLSPISLKEMDRVKLQNRVDTKFVFETELLPQILKDISNDYAVLTIKEKRWNSYRTLYFDTKDLQCYIQHHNGKANRYKIRFRNYIESQLNFLEIKLKNNKSRTIKFRKETTQLEENLSKLSKQFISDSTFFNGDELIPVLWNNFTRITLVNKTINERLTIDLNLSFESFITGEKKELPHIIIAELKQEKASSNSSVAATLKKYHINKSSMSKYCVGSALLNYDIKSNLFKERILKIKKLKYA